MPLRTLSLFSFFFPALVLVVASAAAAEPFVAVYVEGSASNKALAIRNPTGSAIDLETEGYALELYLNGSITPNSIPLAGSVAAGGLFVIAATTASAQVTVFAQQLAAGLTFNGDDAIALRRDATVLDVIGQIGVDPGSTWGSGIVGTQDATLVRKSSVCSGDVDGSDAFDPSVEWDGYATDTFSPLDYLFANGLEGGACI
jgi:predicted extracellular nuclease